MRFKDRRAVEEPRDPFFDRRFLLIPAARLLITIPPDDGRIVLRRLDLEELLQRPLRVLRGDLRPEPRSETASSATVPAEKASSQVPDRQPATFHFLWPARHLVLGVLAALSYLIAIAHRLWVSREAKEQSPESRNARQRIIERLLIGTAYALTIACIYVEWDAYSTARNAARALDTRLTDEHEQEALPRKELESLIGRTPDRSVVQKDGSILRSTHGTECSATTPSGWSTSRTRMDKRFS